jgi:hypothetical protein
MADVRNCAENGANSGTGPRKHRHSRRNRPGDRPSEVTLRPRKGTGLRKSPALPRAAELGLRFLQQRGRPGTGLRKSLCGGRVRGRRIRGQAFGSHSAGELGTGLRKSLRLAKRSPGTGLRRQTRGQAFGSHAEGGRPGTGLRKSLCGGEFGDRLPSELRNTGDRSSEVTPTPRRVCRDRRGKPGDRPSEVDRPSGVTPGTRPSPGTLSGDRPPP